MPCVTTYSQLHRVLISHFIASRVRAQTAAIVECIINIFK
jgi:hypothetical protein